MKIPRTWLKRHHSPGLICAVLGLCWLNGSCGSEADLNVLTSTKLAAQTQTLKTPEPGFWHTLQIINSQHPYANNKNQAWRIDAAIQATQLKITFERFELEQNYDWVVLQYSNNKIHSRHTGNQTGKEVIVKTRSMRIKLQTDYSVTQWGAQIKVEQWIPCQCPKTSQAICGSDGNTYTNACFATCINIKPAHAGACKDPWVPIDYNIQSLHPYKDHMDQSWIVHAPGASQIRLSIDRIDTETGYDFLRILDSNDNVIAQYTGQYRNITTPPVPGDTVKVVFHSDYSINRWGFHINQYEAHSACLTDLDCSPGMQCIETRCPAASCYRICQPRPTQHVTLRTLEINSSDYHNQRIRLYASPTATEPLCTRRKCSKTNPCCNQCSAPFKIGHGIMLQSNQETPMHCSGDNCTWQQSCSPWPFANAGRYLLEGVFTIDAYQNKKLLVHHFSATQCRRTGCGATCANVDTTQGCPEQSTYICYDDMTCAAATNSGLCQWQEISLINQCIAPPSNGPFGSIDTPISIPDYPHAGIESALPISALPATAHNAVISLHINHPFKGDLSVTIFAPDGASMLLHQRSSSSDNNIILDQHPLTALQASPASGTWRLKIQDHVRIDSGTLETWSIDFKE